MGLPTGTVHRRWNAKLEWPGQARPYRYGSRSILDGTLLQGLQPLPGTFNGREDLRMKAGTFSSNPNRSLVLRGRRRLLILCCIPGFGLSLRGAATTRRPRFVGPCVGGWRTCRRSLRFGVSRFIEARLRLFFPPWTIALRPALCGLRPSASGTRLGRALSGTGAVAGVRSLWERRFTPGRSFASRGNFARDRS